MKKKILLFVLSVITAFVFAVACSTKPSSPSEPDASQKPDNPPIETVLSSDTSLTVRSICGAEVDDGKATLTAAQYDALVSAQDKAAKCDYTLAEKATLEITLDGKTLVFAVTAEDGTAARTTVVLTVLSNDTSLIVKSVCGAEVNDGAVTLTTAQYNSLRVAADLKALCVHEIADSAKFTAKLTDRVLRFDVTAQDGTERGMEIKLNVLSDDADFTVRSFYGKSVSDNAITLSEDEYRQFAAIDHKDIGAYLSVVKHDGATVSAVYDEVAHSVTVSSVSEDGSERKQKTIAVNVNVPFGTHSVIDYGNGSNVSWDYDSNAYSIGRNRAAAFKTREGKIVEDHYAVSADVAFTGYATGSEIVFLSYEAANVTVRFYIRFTDADHFSVRSDFRNMSGYKNEMFLKDNVKYTDGEFVNMQIINVGNSTVMLYNGETLYRRTLPTISHSEPMVYSTNCVPLLKNVTVENDRQSVETLFATALEDYTDIPYGKSLLNTSENLDKMESDENGTITIKNSDSLNRVMGAYYQEGVPAGGYEFAVGGTLAVSNAAFTSKNATKVEFQLAELSFNNFIKFHLFRADNVNNSFYIYPTVNGKQSTVLFGTKNNMMKTPENGIYEIEYVFSYDNGKVEAYLKDGSDLLKDFTLVYECEVNWGYAIYAFANRQLCDTEWKETKVYYNEEFDALMERLHSAEDNEFTVSEGGAFVNGQNGAVYKTDSDYASAPILFNGEPFGGTCFVLSGSMKLSRYKNFAQGELILKSDDKHVKYCFEYTQDAGAFQAFTQYSYNGEYWQGYRLIYQPNASNPAYMNFAIVNENGKCSFLINGYVYHVVENMSENVEIAVGGVDCTVKLSRLRAETDAVEVGKFAENMTEPQYVSPYEGRIDSLANQYKNAEKGGTLLAGSSSIDYWDSYAEDLGADELVYNVGIGGTTTADWLYAYDRLVKHFEPSTVLFFLGGNDISSGETAAHTINALTELFGKIHDDFPTARIFYVITFPTPSIYSDGKFNSGYAQLVDGMRQFCDGCDYVTGIDIEPLLVENGTPIPEYFRADRVHLSDAGYAVWASVMKSYLFPEKDV